MAASMIVRVFAPTAATTVATTALTVVVNLATNNKHSQWMWLLVLALTAVSLGATLWLYYRQNSPGSTPPDSSTDAPAPDSKTDARVVGERNTVTPVAQTMRVTGSGNISYQTGRDSSQMPPPPQQPDDASGTNV